MTDIGTYLKAAFSNKWVRHLLEHPNPFIQWPSRFVYRVFRLSGELTAIVLGISLLWLWGFNYLLAKQTVDVSFLGANASVWFSEAFDGHSADVGTVELSWRPQESSFWVHVRDIDVKEKFRTPLQNIEALGASVDFDDAILGKFEPREIHVKGGSVVWKRNEDGNDIASLGTPENHGRLGTFFRRNNNESVAPDAAPAGRAHFTMGTLREVKVTDATIFFVNKRTGLDLRLENTGMIAAQEDGYFTITSFADLPSKGEAVETPLTFDVRFSPDYEDFDLIFSASDFNLSESAPERGPVSILKAIDAPLDIALLVQARRGQGLSEISVRASSGPGSIIVDTQANEIDSLRIAADYDLESEALKLDTIAVSGDKFDFAASGMINDLGTPATGLLNNNMNFDFDVSKGRFDLTPVFQAPISIQNAKLVGAASIPGGTVDISRANMDFGKFTISANGGAASGPDGLSRIYGSGRVDGEFRTPDLLNIWPVKFADGARRWLKRSVKGGLIQNLRYEFDISGDDFGAEGLPHDAVNLTYDVEGGHTKYISTMTPITEVKGRGILHGNSFIFEVDSGVVGDLNVEDVMIDIPRLVPKGGDIKMEIKGNGEVSSLLGLIDQEPFMFASRYGISPDDFAGEGSVNVKITRPLLVNFDQERIKYDVSGTFANVTAPFSVGPHKLEKADVVLTADRSAMIVKGPVNIGPWRADLSWTQEFGEERKPTKYQVQGRVDQEILDKLGVGLRQNFDGFFDLKIDAEGQGLSIREADFVADLTPADIRIGSYWAKPAGTQGQLSGKLEQDLEQNLRADNLVVSAPGMTIEGGFGFAPDFRLLNFDVSKADIEGFVDASLSVKPNQADGRFDVDVSGEFLDISPVISRILRAQAGEGGLPMNLSASLSRLALNEAFVLRDSRIELIHTGVDVDRATITGRTRDGLFNARLEPKADQMRRVLTVSIPDASEAAFAFLKLDNLKGGKMNLEATVPPTGEPGPMRGVLTVDDFILTETPVLASILSLASLKGLTDTLVGAGLGFNEMSVPFSFNEGQLKIREATAYGSALGLTASGDVDLPNRNVDVNGVLVPAYTANSVLGEIPLLGDILVGKDGEGIFALNYTVRGEFSKTQIGVNPLSALTPGVLRRIFDVERDNLPETAEETSEAAVDPQDGPDAPPTSDE